MTAWPTTGDAPAPRRARRRRLWRRIATETALAVVGSGAVCYLAYFLLGLPISGSGAGGAVMVGAPFVVPLLIAPVVAMPFARASERIADLLKEVEHAKRRLTEEIAERVLVQDTLEELARRDPLTGLLNRRGFFEVASERADREVVVMVADVDNFKSVNDEWGHATGDAVLGAIAQALRGSAGSAVVARLGGDEFALLVDEAEAAELKWVSERISAVSVALSDASSMTVSCSVGTATLAVGASIDAALAEADAEMYEAKRSRAQGDVRFDAPARAARPFRVAPAWPARSRTDHA